jgi:hypothetical protein
MSLVSIAFSSAVPQLLKVNLAGRCWLGFWNVVLNSKHFHQELAESLIAKSKPRRLFDGRFCLCAQQILLGCWPALVFDFCHP